MLVLAPIGALVVARIVDRDGALLANRAAPRRVLGERGVGVELLDRAVRSDGEAIGEVGLRGEQVETVHGERVLGRLIHDAHQLVQVAHPRESHRGVPRDRQLGVLGRELLGPLTKREARLLDRAGDEGGHRDHREEREEADHADVDLPPLASEEDLGNERREVRDDRDGAREERSRDPHPEDRREDREDVVREVPRVDPARQHEEDRRDDLGDGRAHGETALSEPAIWKDVEP